MAARKPQTSRKGAVRQGSPSGSTAMSSVVSAANRWREQYNPLRGLTLSRAVALTELYPRGEMADLQWTFLFIEEADPDLFALVERRTSAILEMDWNIKVVAKEKRRADFDETLADEQAAALRDAYERVDNLYEAVEHLAMATFRGFAHCEKYRLNDGTITHLEPVNQWNVVRDGLCGDWKYNPRAQATTFAALSADMAMDPANFLFRQVSRKVDRLGLLKFVRANLSEKDWDAFIEIYGIPGGVIIGPPNVPEEKAKEYEAAAQEVAEGGSGYLPNGAEYKPNDSPRGTNPFRDRLEHLSEKLILAGTGGMLTMLTAPTGLGSGTSDAHADVFASIARGEARRVTECFQRGIDAEILAAAFPGRPALAYFELAANEETNVADIVEHAVKLSQAGFAMDAAELTEKTGYKLTIKPATPAPGIGGPFANRAGANDGATGQPDAEDIGPLLAKARIGLVSATSDDLAPVRAALEKTLATLADTDGPEADKALKLLDAALPGILAQINDSPKSADELEKIFGAALTSGLTATV